MGQPQQFFRYVIWKAMIQKVLSWLTSSTSSWYVYVVLAFACFGGGWYASSVMHERDFEQMRADFFASLQRQEKTFREKEIVLQNQIADALSERDTALADAATARSDTERLRVKTDALAERLSEASSAADDGNRKSLASCLGFLGECVKLQAEGVRLSGEGAELVEKSAADIEVMRRALSQ